MDDPISENEFWTDWGVILTATDDLFALDEVKDRPPNHVWTIVETGSDQDGSWYAAPGFHLVNRLGYVMTRRPWTDLRRDAVYFLDDFERVE